MQGHCSAQSTEKALSNAEAPLHVWGTEGSGYLNRSNWLQIAGSFVQPGGQLSCVQDKGRKTSAKAAALTRYFRYSV